MPTFVNLKVHCNGRYSTYNKAGVSRTFEVISRYLHGRFIESEHYLSQVTTYTKVLFKPKENKTDLCNSVQQLRDGFDVCEGNSKEHKYKGKRMKRPRHQELYKVSA